MTHHTSHYQYQQFLSQPTNPAIPHGIRMDSSDVKMIKSSKHHDYTKGGLETINLGEEVVYAPVVNMSKQDFN